MLGYGKGVVAIHPIRHLKLFTTLRTEMQSGEGAPDKDAYHDDLFNTIGMSP